MDAPKVGLPVGTTIADHSAVLTADGKVRLYFLAKDNIKSAVSSDGITFTVEAGNRIQRSGHFKVMKLDDGRLRGFLGGVGIGGILRPAPVRPAHSHILLVFVDFPSGN